MRLRVPQPLHGWREFSGEVGIIVLGVLIALGASQLVDSWQWRQQINEANKVFESELEFATIDAYLRLATDRCLKDRLQELATKLNERGPMWQGMPDRANAPDSAFGTNLKTLSVPYRATPRAFAPLITEGWDNALANGTINHLPYSRSTSLSHTYATVRQLNDSLQEEAKAETKLAPLANDRSLNPESRLSMLQTVKELDRLNDVIAYESEYILFKSLQTNLGFSDQDFRKDYAPMLQMERNARGKCVVEPQKVPDAQVS